MTLALLILGICTLITGAELLVRGATKLAVSMGMSPLVIGLTVVAFGTSFPEIAVSVDANLLGQGGLALGNVIGSNIFNTLFILGLSALITPLTVSQKLIQRDVPLLIVISIIVYLLGLDGLIGILDGSILVTILLIYTSWLIFQNKKNDPEKSEYKKSSEHKVSKSVLLLSIAMVGIGLVLMVFGSRWFVEAAIAVARSLGVSESLIGLTLLAGGTSMPELVTSVLAAVRGQRDIAVGNVIGSNIFNLMGVLGISSLIGGVGLPVADSSIYFDFPFMLATSIACLPVFFSGYTISRSEGAAYLLFYFVYIFTLIQAPHYGIENTAYQLILPFSLLGLVLFGIAVRKLSSLRIRKL